ncbi:hypothetical protein ACWB3A_18615 [Acinetobacter baumannii]|jgi:hypothetical protein|uniref:Uncharacterized protein n=4 Tax=Acinetobacter TaxID=469 RepID=N9BXJ2_9GAMM|nr:MULTISPECIES: hypothetical protein [Acinetobacter]HBH18454.1 hypothetical protein [Cyanobacteria bacterium UBA9579]AWA48732.1 hypothetical protein CDG57_12535 [Acinetobacter junii]AWL20333.1 hypothetical protein DIW83_15540 [Acinetobacter nosocomialis]ENV78327.1 hypothetical protein F942_02983 [Acinetobacter ursingii ANC 3649]KQE97631.1 hypothetical protein APB99_12085 [Acinetobacter pittii]
MSTIINFLSNPAVGGVAAICTILTTIWGIIQTIRVKKLSQEISNLKTSKKTDTDQRQVKTHDRSTYVEQANDITINHGSD